MVICFVEARKVAIANQGWKYGYLFRGGKESCDRKSGMEIRLFVIYHRLL